MKTRGVQTVTRALSLLTCFQTEESLGVSEVARQQNLALSTTHRLLAALVDAGFLEKDPRSSRYRIGGVLAQYAHIAYRQHRVHLAEPRLEQLAGTTGASASLVMRSGHHAVVLGTSRWREPGGHELQGTRLPMTGSAVGRALLGWSGLTGAELGELRFEGNGERAVTSRAQLLTELEVSRQRGYAFNDEELAPGFRTIGLPLLGHDGRARYALGLRGTTEVMVPERVRFFVELARVTAAEIAEELEI